MEAERLSAVVLESLEQDEAGDLARRAYQSRSQFYRLFRALIDETPVAMRRRLLLERAAWQLARTRASVTEIAFDANYSSLEAFTRAFRKAFRISPSLYRRMGATSTLLPAANGIHFCAASATRKGNWEMDLFDRFAGADSWHTRRLLEAAQTMTDEQLDRPISGTVQLTPWEKPERSVRELLERIVFTKEVWAAAIGGGEMPGEDTDKSAAGLLARFDKIDKQFENALREVHRRGAWDDTFATRSAIHPRRLRSAARSRTSSPSTRTAV